MRPVTRIVLTIVLVLVFGLIPTCGSLSAFPVGSRLAAPLVCPADTAESVVVSRWGGGTRGGNSLKWNLYCVSGQGHGTIPSLPKVFLTLFALWTAIGAALYGVWRLVRRLRARPEAGGANA